MADSDRYRYRDVGYDPGRVRPGQERRERSYDRDAGRDPYADYHYGARGYRADDTGRRDEGAIRGGRLQESHREDDRHRGFERGRGDYGRDRDERHGRDDDRGFLDRAGDEVRSWFRGDDDRDDRDRHAGPGRRDAEFDRGGRYTGAVYARGRDPQYDEQGRDPSPYRGDPADFGRRERGRDEERYRSWGGDTWSATRGGYDTRTPARHDERGGRDEEERYRLQSYGYRQDRHRDDRGRY